MKKNYFITGGTGSFGVQFSDINKKRLLKKIIIFSRDEFNKTK